jgi:iron complex transport system substrate-binding protein
MLKRLSFIILLATIVALVSCSDVETGKYITFEDSLGNTVALDEKPRRVAVLLSSLCEEWQIAGGEVAITVGESVERGFVPSDTLLVDTGAGKHVSTELLISYEPDLVIGSADIESQRDVARTLQVANIPTALFRVDSFSDYLAVLDIMTDVTGDKNAYKQYGTDIKEKIDSLIASGPSDEKDILFIRASTSAKSTKAKSSDQHFVAEMISELGAHNIADDAPILLDGLNLESIIENDPEVIFISVMGDEDAVRAYMDGAMSGDAWQTVSAVRQGKCYYLPKEYSQFKPNAEWYEAYLMLWELLYA